MSRDDLVKRLNASVEDIRLLNWRDAAEASSEITKLLAMLREIIQTHDEWVAELEPAKRRGAVFDDPLDDTIEKARRLIGSPQSARQT